MSIFKKLRSFFPLAPSQGILPYASPTFLAKAVLFEERYREVVSDPINFLVNRVPEAGYVDGNNCVILHNGLRVPLRGPGSYYENFSDLLIINRGVHEPLEEYCFQSLLGKLATPAPVMLELGAYWAHYSMWLKKVYPSSVCHMVEADAVNLEAGRANFRANGFTGKFYQEWVGKVGFSVDAFLRNQGLSHLDILHSDLQGFEVEALEGAAVSLREHRIDRIFVSTHSELLHQSVENTLRSYGYHIEVSSPFESHTTSCDGFILASAPGQLLLLEGWRPLGRIDIARATPAQLIASVASRMPHPL